MAEITKNRHQVYVFDQVADLPALKSGYIVIVKNAPGCEGRQIMLVTDGVKTIRELFEVWKQNEGNGSMPEFPLPVDKGGTGSTALYGQGTNSLINKLFSEPSAQPALLASFDIVSGGIIGRTTSPEDLKSALGLSNVDNTSDENKPISNAMTDALKDKANNDHSHQDINNKIQQLEEAFDGLQLNSPFIPTPATCGTYITDETVNAEVIVNKNNNTMSIEFIGGYIYFDLYDHYGERLIGRIDGYRGSSINHSFTADFVETRASGYDDHYHLEDNVPMILRVDTYGYVSLSLLQNPADYGGYGGMLWVYVSRKIVLNYREAVAGGWEELEFAINDPVVVEGVLDIRVNRNLNLLSINIGSGIRMTDEGYPYGGYGTYLGSFVDTGEYFSVNSVPVFSNYVFSGLGMDEFLMYKKLFWLTIESGYIYLKIDNMDGIDTYQGMYKPVFFTTITVPYAEA